MRLCCLIAAVPFGFFVTCSATNFIDLFGRETVGWPGLVLSAFTLVWLAGSGVLLSTRRDRSETFLRAMEIAVFGMMAACSAYWQFAVLTAYPLNGFEGNGHETASVLAAALIVYFVWFVLIIFHGVLVPNTPGRGAAVAVGMCVVAIAISIVAVYVHPPTARHAIELYAISVTMLGAGAGLSVFGTAKTQALQLEVLSALEAVRELGQYRLRQKLGIGGMGEVYLAEHSLLKRPCAVKRIHPRLLNNPEQVRRFEREVQATAQLRHPNTVEIYDYGRADDGTFFYAMEYVPGVSLEDLVVKYGPLPPDRVVHILRQVCGALKEAHRHGLVHRDIKPSNILVCADGPQHDHVKLLDFGLVQSLIPEEAAADQKLTREGLIVGTPEYMSPEQATGGNLDGRSDLFSVGSIAYFLLTGQEAFHRGNSVKTLLAVVGEEPPPIADRTPYAPADVLAVVGKLLAKESGDRYQRAADAEADLARCRCAGHWTEDRAAEWWATRAAATARADADLYAQPTRESPAVPTGSKG
jgi:serine/threonine-protein kinase